MHSNFVCIISLFCLLLHKAEIGNGEYLPSLRLAHVIYRHGDRAPTEVYPTDPNPEDSWPGGWGSLTELGIKQQYELGQYFRRYFGDFINSTYDHREIHVRSSDFDRNLLSAYSNVAGLYGQDGVGPVHSPLVPVHAPVPVSLDAMLVLDVACEKYDAMKKIAFHSKEVKRYEEENKEFLSMVRRESGLGSNGTIKAIAKSISDTVKVERIHNLPQPGWISDEVADKLWEVRELFLKLLVYTSEMTANRAGLFYRDLNSYLQNYTSGAMDRRMKIFFYSAHELSILAYLHVLNLWDGKIPEFATALFYELHELQPDVYYVRLLYRNETDEESKAYVLTIKDCDTFCPVDKFFKITEPYTWHSTWQDWFKACDEPKHYSQKLSSKSSLKPVPGTGIAVACTLCIALIGIAIYLTVFHKKNKYRTYSAL